MRSERVCSVLLKTIGLISRANQRRNRSRFWIFGYTVAGSKIVGSWSSEIRKNPESHLARQGWRFIRRQLRCNVAAAARGGGRFCRCLVETFSNSTKQTA